MAYDGDVDGALAVVDRALAEPEDEEPVYGAWRAVWAFRLTLAVTAGYFDQSPVESIYDAAAAAGEDRLGLWFSACLAGTKAMAAGDAAAARRWAAELVATTPAMTGGPVLAAGHAVRACLLALVGEVVAAEAALADMEAERTAETGMFDDDMAAARYAVAAASGDLALAQALALSAADEALELGRHTPMVVHAANAARYGRVGPAAERMRAVAGRLTGPLPTALASHVLAWSRSDAAGLDAVSQRYAAMGAYLPAAEAAVTATRLHQEAGRRTAAAASGARAAELVRRCAGCRSPVLEGAPRPWSLTSRELQVARLAAQDLGNRQIADRLGVSTRTIETHLHHAYAKLGVAGRSQLRAAFGDGPPQS
jgi:DNA-binding CsgD family transcriptional regulator